MTIWVNQRNFKIFTKLDKISSKEIFSSMKSALNVPVILIKVLTRVKGIIKFKLKLYQAEKKLWVKLLAGGKKIKFLLNLKYKETHLTILIMH